MNVADTKMCVCMLHYTVHKCPGSVYSSSSWGIQHVQYNCNESNR